MRENLELRAEIAIIKSIAVYAINVRQSEGEGNVESQSNKPCG